MESASNRMLAIVPFQSEYDVCEYISLHATVIPAKSLPCTSIRDGNPETGEVST